MGRTVWTLLPSSLLLLFFPLFRQPGHHLDRPDAIAIASSRPDHDFRKVGDDLGAATHFFPFGVQLELVSSPFLLLRDRFRARNRNIGRPTSLSWSYWACSGPPEVLLGWSFLLSDDLLVSLLSVFVIKHRLALERALVQWRFLRELSKGYLCGHRYSLGTVLLLDDMQSLCVSWRLVSLRSATWECLDEARSSVKS